jgi:hypothetical protein
MSSISRTDFDGAVPSRVGLRLEDGLEFDAWCEIGKKIAGFANASAWWIADWLHFGQWEYGSKYLEAVAATGFDEGTLRNMASVAGRVEMSRRRDKLSFGHHVVVAALDPEAQDAWLIRAEAEGLSVMALREQIRGTRTPPSPVAVLRLSAPPERAAQWHAAADREGLDFNEWAMKALDEASQGSQIRPDWPTS